MSFGIEADGDQAGRGMNKPLTTGPFAEPCRFKVLIASRVVVSDMGLREMPWCTGGHYRMINAAPLKSRSAATARKSKSGHMPMRGNAGNRSLERIPRPMASYDSCSHYMSYSIASTIFLISDGKMLPWVLRQNSY